MKSCLEMLAEIECDEGHELMLQGNDSVSVAKDVEYNTNEVRKREGVKEERSEKGRRRMGGQVEKEQGTEEREKGRKGQRGRGQEGRKKEEKGS